MDNVRPAALLLLIVVMSPLAAAQCCDVPIANVIGKGTVTVSQREVWMTDMFVNGTLIVDDELTIKDAEVVMGGAGIRITENGTLSVIRSRISPHPDNTGFYIENQGDLELEGSVLERCSDPDNPLIGLYQTSGELAINGSEIVSSGLIHCVRSTALITRSDITGLVSTDSDCTVEGCRVMSMGITQYGDSLLVVRDTAVTSSLSFSSPVSAVSSLDGGKLILEDLSINGSYDGGIYSRNGKLSISHVSVSLKGGLYGLRSENATFDRLESLDIEGTMEGITLLGTASNVLVEDCTVDANYSGLLWNGGGKLSMVGCEFDGSTYGAVVRGPSMIGGCEFRDNLIGLLAEEGASLKVTSSKFIGFTKWGIEEETWTAREHGMNVFSPASGAKGTYAWWGRVDVSVMSDKGFEVESAELELRTMGDEPIRISSGPVGMVWGYSYDGDTIAAPTVNISARWGTSSTFKTFRPMEMEVRSLTLMLRLSDLEVSGILMEYRVLSVEVTVLGPGVRDARITIYVDGSYRTSELFDLGPNGTATFSFELSGLTEGDHEVSVRVTSRDEYSGSDGALLGNNELSIQFKVNDDNGGDSPYILLAFCLMLVSLLVLAIVIYVKRSGPKV